MVNRRGWLRVAVLAACGIALGLPLTARGAEDYHGRRAWALQNDRMKVLVTPGGGHIASMTLRSGRGADLNPLWLPPWKSVEPGRWEKADGEYGNPPDAPLLSSILGHNLCLDFFGAPSAPETAAGIPVHGEAPCVDWTARQETATRLEYTAQLPHAQMRVTRQITLTPNSSTIWITEKVDNQAALDRPFGWQQHPTIGPPFLEAGASYFDMPATWSMVFPNEFSKGERLKRGAEFQWPNAPRASSGTVNLREWPVRGGPSSDFTASLIDPSLQWGWFTAVNIRRGLLIGYIWPRADWPWVGNWEEDRFREGKPWVKKGLTRGMEFGTTPFPVSRRDAVAMSTLHGVPTYRWIDARGGQTIGYGAFLAPVPEGTTGVRSVELQGNRIRIRLNGADRTIELPVDRPAQR